MSVSLQQDGILSSWPANAVFKGSTKSSAKRFQPLTFWTLGSHTSQDLRLPDAGGSSFDTTWRKEPVSHITCTSFIVYANKICDNAHWSCTTQTFSLCLVAQVTEHPVPARCVTRSFTGKLISPSPSRILWPGSFVRLYVETVMPVERGGVRMQWRRDTWRHLTMLVCGGTLSSVVLQASGSCHRFFFFFFVWRWLKEHVLSTRIWRMPPTLYFLPPQPPVSGPPVSDTSYISEDHDTACCFDMQRSAKLPAATWEVTESFKKKKTWKYVYN